MKLHLPKLLLTAVMAACVAPAFAAYTTIEDQTFAEGQIPTYQGSDFSHLLYDNNQSDGRVISNANIDVRYSDDNNNDNDALWVGSGNTNNTHATAQKPTLVRLDGKISGAGTLKFNEYPSDGANFVIYELTNSSSTFTGNINLEHGHDKHADVQLNLNGVDTAFQNSIVHSNGTAPAIINLLSSAGIKGLTGSNSRITSSSVNNVLTLNNAAGVTNSYSGTLGSGTYHAYTLEESSTTFANATSTAISLKKLGAGTQTFTGAANLHNVTVGAGTLNLNGATTLGGSVTTSGGTLNLNGATTLSGTVTANGGTLNLNGVLTINAGSTVSISGTTTTNIDKVISNAGSLSLGNVKFNLDKATSEVIGSLDDTVMGTQSFSEKYTFITGSGTVTKVGDFTFSKNGATYAGTLADDNKSVQTSATRYNIAVGGTADASTALQATVENAAVSRVNVLGTMTGVYDGAWAEGSAVQVTGNGTVQVTGHLETHNAKFAGFTGTILVDGNDPNTGTENEPNGGRIHLGTAVDAFSNSTIVLTGAVINGTTPARGYITGWRSDRDIQTFKQNIVLKGGAIKAENYSRWKSVTVDNADGATDTVSYYIAVGSGTGFTEGDLNLDGGTLKFLGSNSVRLSSNVKFDGGVLDLNNLTVESNTKIANLQIVRGSTGEIKNGSLYVQNFDMRGSDAKPYGGTLTLTNANIMLDTNWSSGNGAKVLLEGNSSFTHAGAKISSTTESGQASIVSQADLNPQSFVSSEGVTITNATVTANNANMTISAKLKDSSVTNASSGSLTVADMTVTDASAKQSTLTGNMTVNKLTLASGLSETVAAVTTSGALTLGNITLDLTNYAAGNYTLVSATGDGSITWSEDAWSKTGLGEGLMASVGFAGENSGSLQLSIANAITTTTVTGYSLNETGTALTLNVEEAVLMEGMVVNVNLLTDDLMQAILADMKAIEGAISADGKAMVSITLAGSVSGTITADTMDEVVFVNPDAPGQNYWGEMVDGVGLQYNVARIPEPTTATLSLLALVGLAARRRRQK